MDWFSTKKPHFLGLLTGAVAGLATITPAAGYVSPATACLIGLIAGFVCFYAVALKNRLGWDDALDVWGVHGVGGFLGIVLCGIFATTAFNPDGRRRPAAREHSLFPGAARGGGDLVDLGVRVHAGHALADRSRSRRSRSSAEQEAEGLDSALHGEIAYPVQL